MRNKLMCIKSEVDSADMRRVYEECQVQIIRLGEEDLLTASTDVGEEYPEIWG